MVFIKKYKKYFMTSGIIWAVCLVLLVLVYMLVIGPQNRKRKRVESELDKCMQNYEFAQKAAQEETRTRLHKEIELLQNKLTDFVVDFKR